MVKFELNFSTAPRENRENRRFDVRYLKSKNKQGFFRSYTLQDWIKDIKSGMVSSCSGQVGR